MKKYIFATILVVILTQYRFMEAGIIPMSPMQMSLGQTGLGKQNAAMISAINPALLSLVPGSSFSAGCQRLYNLAELDQISIALSHDFGFAGLGIIYSNLGQADFWMDNSFTLAVSANLKKYIALGFKGEHERVSFDERYGTLRKTSIALGFALSHEDFVVHIALSDLNRPRFSDRDRKTETGYRIGLSLSSIPQIVVNLETSGRKKGEQRYHFGQEVQLERMIFIRFGLVTNPTLPCAGLGINLDKFHLDYALSSHNDLGESHNLGISVNF